MENEHIVKSYYAIIPANVRYDNDLTPNAKLLYGEITALCNEKGYCWATNSYFAELYGVSKTSISKWISQLIEKGYIMSQINYKDNSKEVDKRHLYIGGYPIKEKLNTPTRKVKGGYEEKLNTPIEEKLKDNTTVFNNTINNTFNTTQSSAVVDTNIELVENKTHLKLSNNMKKIVNSWDKERLSKVIELFSSKDGKYFSLLEKIYKDDGNYSNSSINNIKTNYSIPKTKFHNFTENFLDGFESEEAFDKHIEDKLR